MSNLGLCITQIFQSCNVIERERRSHPSSRADIHDALFRHFIAENEDNSNNLTAPSQMLGFFYKEQALTAR